MSTNNTGFRDAGYDLGDRFVTKEYLAEVYRGLPSGVVNGGLNLSGSNDYGQLGDKTLTAKNGGVYTSGLNWRDLSVSPYFSAGIKANGTLWAWGSGFYGSLGIGISGGTAQRSSPSQVGSATKWKVVTTCGLYAMLAIQDDGTLWSCGQNQSGELGFNDVTQRNTITQVGSDTTWKFITASNYFATVLAVKTDGTLWAWGQNSFGNLGDGTTTNRSSPVQVGSSPNWRSAATGINTSYGIKKDGTLWVWGSNTQGGFGDGTTSGSALTPIQVGTDTTWRQISSGEYHQAAIKTNGSLWTWGINTNGSLGSFASGNKTSPVQTDVATNDWLRLSKRLGTYSTMAIKQDGSLWAWGRNNNGQLGLGNTLPRSTPVQRASGSWVACDMAMSGATARDIAGGINDLGSDFNWLN